MPKPRTHRPVNNGNPVSPLALSPPRTWSRGRIGLGAGLVVLLLAVLMAAPVARISSTTSKASTSQTASTATARTTTTATTTTTTRDTTSTIIAGFLPEYRLASRNLSTLCSKISHLILFSLEIHPDTGALVSKDRFQSFLSNPPLPTPCRLILALGGDGRSAGFAPVARDARKRARLVKDLSSYANTVHGVELNWQFPRSHSELQNLAQLCKDIKAAIPLWQISMAIPPASDFARALVAVLPLPSPLDLIHIMLYQNGVVVGGKGVQLARETLAQLLTHLPASSCTLGIAFYGQDPATGAVASYEQVVHEPAKHSRVNIYSRADIHALVGLSQELRLGGVSLWELGQDCRLEAYAEHQATCGRAKPMLDMVLEGFNPR